MGSKTAGSESIVSLPQGGGALQGFGEKFSPDLFTGTGSFTVPIKLPAGRNGFAPQINLAYSPGSSNGPFGYGWTLSIPGIARKTTKGIPRYRDGATDSKPDVFILAGVEDLVPVTGAPAGAQRYAPRTEGLFALIDRVLDGQNDYWRVQTKDGLINYYGTEAAAGNDAATVAHPTKRRDVFAWKLTRTEDPFGNHIEYKYARDQGDGVTRDWDQIYLKQIRYVDYTHSSGQMRYLVTVDFLYDNDPPPPGASAASARPDAFSEFRSGFQIRTRRRCKWIVVATHPAPDARQLVQAHEFVYLDERTDLPNLSDRRPLNGASLLSRIEIIGYDDANQPARELAPLEFDYSRFEPHKRTFSTVTGTALPSVSLGHPDYELVDLFGNGLPDILEMNDTVRYWRNLGGGAFDLPRSMPAAPAVRLADTGVQLIDANGDGRTDLLVTTGTLPAGYYSLTFKGGWDSKNAFQRYQQAPSFNLEDPEVRLIDLDGDGVTDAIRAGTRLECFFNDPHWGWQASGDHVRAVERVDGFPQNFSDPRVKWADMTGDSMQDAVLVHGGRLEYFPNLGYGEFGARVTMRRAPRLPFDYDPRRVLVGDVDGDGLADVIYIENRQLTLWINQSGDSWSEPITIRGTPSISDMDSVRLVDLHGTGVAGVLWTRDAAGDGRARNFFFDFTGGVKPYVLTEMNNHIGAITKVTYASSTIDYLRDQANRNAWRTPLPFPVQVVSRVEAIDEISKATLVTNFRYHHGYWDGAEREFRGFGMVEQIDAESFERSGTADRKYFSPRTLTKTWFHLGAVGEEFGDWEEQDYTDEYWPGDPQLLEHGDGINAFLRALPQRRIRRDALRALRGVIVRSELYALDDTAYETRPYTVTEQSFGLREEHVLADAASTRPRVFFPHQLARRTTEWERGDDPLTLFSFTGSYDVYGQPLSQSTLAMPRRERKRFARRDGAPGDDARVLATHSRTVYAAPGPNTQRYIRNRVARATSFTFLNKPSAAETRPNDLFAVLGDHALWANRWHRQFESELRYWQPVQGNVGNCKVFAHAVTFYDGAAYQGEALGVLGAYGAPARSETLALTDAILDAAYNDAIAVRRPAYLGGTVALPAGAPTNFGVDHGYLDRRNGSTGYVPGYYVASQQQKLDTQAGVAGARGLMLARRDALNNETVIDDYDEYQLLPIQVTDPLGLVIRSEYNMRVLGPRKVTDPNGNFSEVTFSPSGLVTATWIKGKNGEGDQTEPGTTFFYDFLSWMKTGVPTYVRAIKRCHHDTEIDVPLPERNTTIETREYSDGFGRVLQKRTQGEEVRFGDAVLGGGASVLPADQKDGAGGALVGTANTDPDAPNVVVSGWQVYDNKGQVVEKYEPFFSEGWDCESAADSRQGVHVEMYYDPRGRVVRTVNPDGSEQRAIRGVPYSLNDPLNVAPTPWEMYTYDPNDNAGRTHGNDATARTYQHHWNTPGSIVMDALGRTVRTAARDRESTAAPLQERITESRYDIQGNVLEVVDALGRAAFSHTYDLTKHVLHTISIDAGTKHSILNAIGSAIENHDSKGAIALYRYDAMSRPTRTWARDNATENVTLRERLTYGDDASVPDSAAHNLRGKLHQHFDEAGVLIVTDCDFKGNVVDSIRQVLSDEFMLAEVRDHMGPVWALRAPRVDWDAAWATPPEQILDTREYRTRAAFDAFNRIKWSAYPAAANGERYRIRPGFSLGGPLERLELEGPLDANDTGPRELFVQHIAYNAKGQRAFIAYGNGTITRSAYDPGSLRLVRLRTEGFSQPDALTYEPGDALLQDLAYQHDLIGNILRIVDRTPGSGVRNNPRALNHPGLEALLTAGDALVREFAYDPHYRLISATGRECDAIPEPRPDSDDARCGYDSGNHGPADQDNAPDLSVLYQERYEYDPADNLLRIRHQRLNAAANWSRYFGMSGFTPLEWRNNVASLLAGNAPDFGTTGNRLTNFGGDEQQGSSHTYDASGNLITENTERHFEWDHADRLKAFRNQTGTSRPTTYALYLYDASGMRVKKLVWTGTGYRTTTYIGALFEHHAEHETLDGTGRTENCSLHLVDDKRRLATVRVGDPFDDDGAREHPVQYRLEDHLGSVSVVVSGSGDWINREEYFPFGETSFGSYGRKRYRHTGMERDEESGLSYHAARYYMSWVGRWASPDAAGPADGWNLFVFVGNNPMCGVDRTGYQNEPADGGTSPDPTDDAASQPAEDDSPGAKTARTMAHMRDAGYAEKQVMEWVHSKSACFDIAASCRDLTERAIDARLADAKKVASKFSPAAQDNMSHWLGNSASEKVMSSTLFEKHKKVQAALEGKWRQKIIDGVKSHIADGSLNVTGPDTPFTLEWMSALEAYSTNPKDDLAFSVGGFQLKSVVKVLVTQTSATKYHVTIVSWENQVFDVYNWDPGKAVSVAAAMKALVGLPSDTEMCCAENANKGSAFPIRTDPWSSTDQKIVGPFDVRVKAK